MHAQFITLYLEVSSNSLHTRTKELLDIKKVVVFLKAYKILT